VFGLSHQPLLLRAAFPRPTRVPRPQASHRRFAPLAWALALIVGLGASACGNATPAAGSSQSHAPAPQGTFPVTIDAANGSVTLDHPPTRIVSLSPTATEILFAMGAGSQVVAVDDQSNYPSSAPTTKLSGYTPNVEAVAGYSPDLVIASDEATGLSAVLHGLQGLGIPVLVLPAARNLSDTYHQIDELGTATGHAAEATSLDAKIKQQISSILASVPKPTHPLSVYHELDSTYYSVTSATFIGQVYTLLGLTNIADGASNKVPDYPQLSAEYIIQSDPDLIVLADTKCCQQDAKTVAARPGWGKICAVQDGEVIPVDDDIASRWGPRVVDFIRIIAAHVKQIEEASADKAATP
jgi:iron complex transport system substrate-binding protein